MIYAFGDNLLDTDRYELRVAGKPRPVEPQVFDLLQFLIENRDRVVTRDELFQEIWSGRIVSDSSLTSRIKAARKAIGDSGIHQRFISTLRGRGIRFTGTVEIRDNNAPLPGQSRRPDEVQKTLADNAAGKPSLAVMPFVNNGQSDQEIFADGITEEVIARLSMTAGLMVISSNSTRAYKRKQVSTQEISSDLNVRYIVEGSIWSTHERLRVTAQLIDTQTRSTLWAQHFDSTVEGVFELHDRIAEGIAGALQSRLLLAEANLVRRKPPQDLDAWENVISARIKLFAYDRQDIDNAEPHVRRALEIDPEYGEAHGVLCHILAWRSYNGWCDDFRETARQSIKHGNLALTYAPMNPEVLGDVGFSRMWLGRPREALPFLRRSIELNPNSALTCAQYGCALAVHGLLDEAFRHCHRATTLSPRDPLEYFFQLCLAAAYQLNGEHEKAVEAARHSISLNPNNCWSYVVYASSCVRLGMMEEAKRAISQTEKLSKTAVPNIFRCWSEGTLWHIHADPIRMIYNDPNTDDG